MVTITTTATACCAFASILSPASAFITPRADAPSHSTALPLYQEDGAPYPPIPGGGKKRSPSSSPLVKKNVAAAAVAGDDDDSAVLNDDDNDEDEAADFVGAGTLGDIMGTAKNPQHVDHPSSFAVNGDGAACTAVSDGLVTSDGCELNARFAGCDFDPMERIALTANGNLQRIFSSYYDAPVHVHVDSCSRRKCGSGVEEEEEDDKVTRRDRLDGGFDPKIYGTRVVDGDAVWDRVVSIQVHGRTICQATSVISVRSPQCIQLIDDGSVGLGQMFRHLNRLPTFSLLDAGRTTSESSEFGGGMWRTYELNCDEMTCLIHEEFLRDSWSVPP